MAQQSTSSNAKNAGVWSKACEDYISKQINMELYASYVYMALGHFFDRDDVALKNVAKFFLKNSEEEREHANKLVVYHNQRGGTTVYKPIEAPTAFDPANFNTVKAMHCALTLEVTVNKSLLAMHAIADGDPEDFIEMNFLHEQVEAIKMFKDYITDLKRVGTGVGEYLFDKHFNDDD